MLEIKVVGQIPARRQKLYYLIDHERGSTLKYTPPVMSVTALQDAAARKESGNDKKQGKGKKTKKK